jgi:hypothetical protein
MCVVAVTVRADADVLPLPLGTPARLFAWEPDVQDYHVHVGLAVDREGNAFVSDEARVWKVSSSGEDVGNWTIPDSETGFIEEIEISPDGEIFILDIGNERVLRYSADGVLVDSWPVPDAWRCGDMVINEAREVFVVDWGNRAVRVFTSYGESLRSWEIPYGSGGIAVDPGGDLLLGVDSHLVRFTTEGQQLQELTWNSLDYGFSPAELAIDAGGNVYVAGGLATGVLTPLGSCLATIPEEAWDIAVGPGGEVFLLGYDWSTEGLLKFEALPSGVAVTSDPPGRPVFVDGVAHTTPLFHAAPPGSEHTYSVHASEEPAMGTRVDFAGWNDGSSEPSRTLVAGVAPGTLHASFETFFRLTVTSTPGGTVSPGSGWYPKDSDIELLATPAAANVFVSWSLLPDPTSICCQYEIDVCCQTQHEESNPITVSMLRARAVEAAFTEENPLESDYELSISASDSDPFVHSAPPAGVRNLYLWLTASEPGTSEIEADVHASGSLQVLDFSPVGGVLNVETEGDLLLTIPSCPSGEEIALLLGYWAVIDNGGSLGLQPSEANGILGAVDCREAPALWDVRVLGFESDPLESNYELSISASDNDPFVHVAPATGVRNLYLWLTASEPGIAALEADVQVGGSLEVFGFTAVGGVLNVATAGDLLLAIPHCPSGAETALLLGYWAVMDNGGSLCLQPSAGSGTLGAVDCRQLYPAVWDVRVLGFASDGPPCVLGSAHDLTHRPAPAEDSNPLTSPLGEAVTALHAPYPNPFRGESVLGFSLAGPAHASVSIYDVAGRLVRRIVDRPLPAGVHSAPWNGRDELGSRVASGTYFVRLETGEDSRTRKIVLLRSE